LKNSGYGIYIGSLFLGCILYADDTLLLSGSCTSLQRMVNICTQYGVTWDICFSPSKSHYIVFGGSCSSLTQVTIDKVELRKGGKLKYLGCYFHEQNGRIDLNHSICKFYGNFNNVMSVIGYNKNEMAALHLIKSHCVPTILCGCETGHLDNNDYHRLNVITCRMPQSGKLPVLNCRECRCAPMCTNIKLFPLVAT